MSKDGGPAFICRHCGCAFQPKEWQRSSYDYRCSPCKREKQNAANQAKDGAIKKQARHQSYLSQLEYSQTYWLAKRSDPLHLLKRKARRKVATEIEAGRLTRLPCEDCGGIPTDAHHSDYSEPLTIRWLCRRCHVTEERKAA